MIQQTFVSFIMAINLYGKIDCNKGVEEWLIEQKKIIFPQRLPLLILLLDAYCQLCWWRFCL